MDARRQALQIPFERSRQRLIEVTHIEQQLPLGRRPVAEVQDVRVTAHLDSEPGMRRRSEIGGHHGGCAAQVCPAGRCHPRIPQRKEILVADGFLRA
jgi:hypothetical protein